MALNKEFFEKIHFDLEKKKYYNAGRVDVTLKRICREAEQMQAELQSLREEVKVYREQRGDISDAFLSARTIAQSMIQEANETADRILADAEKDAVKIRLEAEKVGREDAIRRTMESFSRIRDLQTACLEATNEEWQNFLAEQVSEEDEEAAPEDLSDKVGAIADALSAFLPEDDETEE